MLSPSMYWACTAATIGVLLAGCGSGDSVGPLPPAPPPPPPPVVTSVEVTPTASAIAVADTIRLTAIVKDQRGQAMTGRSIDWTSSSTSVATVANNGLVTAVGAGVTTVTATVEGKSGPAQVTVFVPVASVLVTPASAALTINGRIQLAAIAQAAGGDSIPGKTMVWSTNNGSVATVSAQGLVSAVAAGQATITATVDGRNGTSQIMVLAPGDNVQEEPARAVSDTIGVGGGELRATGGNGAKYTLTVPAGALRKGTRITMTPVATIQAGPFSTFAGAVDLQPTGLAFAKPAVLAIETPATRDTSLRLVGFSFEADADSLVPTVARDSARVIRMLVPHFSGSGAAFVTTGGMLTLLGSPGPSNQSQTYINALTGIASGNVIGIYSLMRQWMTNVIVPALQNASTDIQLFFAVAQYNWWLATTVGIVSGIDLALQAERDAAAQAALPKLREVIGDNNAQCLAQRDIDGAAGALFWQTVAEDFGLATSANQLDRPTVLNQLCIKVVLTSVSFPGTVSPGNGATLDVLAGVQFGTQTQILSSRFTWTLDISGSTADGVRNGLSDDVGRFFQNVTPAGNQALTLFTTMCLAALEVPYADVCAGTLVSRTPAPLLEWNFDDDLEGWSPLGNAIHRGAGGREVARLDTGGAIENFVSLPSGVTTFEFEISAHDRPNSVSHFTVRVIGAQSAATILDATKNSGAGGYSFGVMTANLAAFAGQGVIIRITQFDQSNGQLYIDRIAIR